MDLQALVIEPTESFQSSTYNKSISKQPKANSSKSGAHGGSTDDDEGLEEFLRMKDMETLAKKDNSKQKVLYIYCVCIYIYVHICMYIYSCV